MRDSADGDPRRDARGASDSRWASWNQRVGISFLIVQLALVGYARFVPERFFAWAPYDTHACYEVRVYVGGRRSSSEQVRERYRYAPSGAEPRSIHNLLAITFPSAFCPGTRRTG